VNRWRIFSIAEITVVENQNITDAKSMIQKSIKESDALFALNMWATFERFLGDDILSESEFTKFKNLPN